MRNIYNIHLIFLSFQLLEKKIKKFYNINNTKQNSFKKFQDKNPNWFELLIWMVTICNVVDIYITRLINYIEHISSRTWNVFWKSNYGKDANSSIGNFCNHKSLHSNNEQNLIIFFFGINGVKIK